MTPRYALVLRASVAALCLVGGAFATALAQGDMDTPLIGTGVTGTAKATLTITAGATGAPAGFTIWWMKQSDYIANGGDWFLYGDPGQGEAGFTGTPTLNTNGGQYTTFALGPNQSIAVEVGDLADESGVSVIDPSADVTTGGELEYNTSYVFCAFANATAQTYQSALTVTVQSGTHQPTCTLTQGYWKNHPNDWPAFCLPMILGNNSYTKSELLQILNQSVGGNGAISLAHQLIAAKLNVCHAANAVSCITTGDQLLAASGSNKVPPLGNCTLAPGGTSGTTQCLDNFNNDSNVNCAITLGLPHSWGAVKTIYRR